VKITLEFPPKRRRTSSCQTESPAGANNAAPVSSREGDLFALCGKLTGLYRADLVADKTKLSGVRFIEHEGHVITAGRFAQLAGRGGLKNGFRAIELVLPQGGGRASPRRVRLSSFLEARAAAKKAAEAAAAEMEEEQENISSEEE
jgi:hypothetical protein